MVAACASAVLVVRTADDNTAKDRTEMRRMLIACAPNLRVSPLDTDLQSSLMLRTARQRARHAPGKVAQPFERRARGGVRKWPIVLTLLCLMSIFGMPGVIGAQPTPGVLAALDREYGFRGVHFGAGLSELKGAKLVGERGACEKAYVRPGDGLEVGDVKLSSIEYSFQNGRLTVVSLLASADACVNLYRTLTRMYGEDTTKQGAGVASQPFWTATWEGQRVRLDLVGPQGCTATMTAPEEAILEERQCREDDRMEAGKGP